MMKLTVDKLTEEVWKEFGDRKQDGRLDLVYNRKTGNFIAVPKGIEHKDFMFYLDTDYESLIPVQIRVSRENGKNRIKRLILGVSSFEEELNIRHPMAYIVEAYHQTIIQLLNEEQFEISANNFEYSRRHVTN